MDAVQDKVKSTTEQIGQGAERITRKAKEVSTELKDLAERAERNVETMAEDAAAAGGARLERFAHGVRTTSKRIRKGEVSAADRLEHLADRLEATAHYLEKSKARDMVLDARRRGREHPAVLAGGLFVIGFGVGLLFGHRASRRNLREVPEEA